jgi:geranylgeranylglycerol-phosphate geranylgeranyltransferase
MLARPQNALITALSVLVGSSISKFRWWEADNNAFVAALSAALIAAGGNAYNDYCDRELDRQQKSHRPLPSGRLTPAEAIVFSVMLFSSGLVLSIPVGGSGILVAVGATLLLLSYSWRWKRTPLVGNLVVAYVAALAFIYGGIAVGPIDQVIWAGLLAFLFHIGREVVKDMEDREGDMAAAANTMVVRYGMNSGRWVVMISQSLLVSVLPLPYLFGGFSDVYLWIVLSGVLPVLIYTNLGIWRWSTATQLHKLSTLLKWDMLIGLGALYFGRI